MKDVSPIPAASTAELRRTESRIRYHLRRAAPAGLTRDGLGALLEAEGISARNIGGMLGRMAWYAAAFPEYRAALEDLSWILPAGEDVLADHRLAILKNGSPGVSDLHVKGSDGEDRHGDSMIASLLAHYATAGEAHQYGYQAARPKTPDPWRRSRRDDDRRAIGRDFRGVV